MKALTPTRARSRSSIVSSQRTAGASLTVSGARAKERAPSYQGLVKNWHRNAVVRKTRTCPAS